MKKMSVSYDNISKIVFSPELIWENITSIIDDSIVLNNRYEIVNICDSVLGLLGFEREELIGKNVKLLDLEGDIITTILEESGKGFFLEKEYKLQNRQNEEISLGISGFYMGMISDINDCIVLKVKNIHDFRKVSHQLLETSTKLEHFLYRISHDLRGPLATIMGLAYVANLEEDNPKKKFYFDEILNFANKLDHILRNIESITHPKY